MARLIAGHGFVIVIVNIVVILGNGKLALVVFRPIVVGLGVHSQPLHPRAQNTHFVNLKPKQL